MKRPDLALRNIERTRHGHARGRYPSPTWLTWHAMLQRAHTGSCKDAPRYLGRGITVCERWLTFEGFLADMGERPDGKTIDRIDNARGYEPGNCRWATPREQALNRRSAHQITAFGRTQHITEWARERGMSHQLLKHRLRAGWPLEEALMTPASRSANSRWRRKEPKEEVLR